MNGSLVVNNMNLMVQAALDGIGIGYTINLMWRHILRRAVWCRC